jgi:ribokinase
MSNIEVVGLGALNIDHIYRVERILDDGEGVINEAESFPGGSAANTIYGLAKLGMSTGFTGVLGDDAEGEILMRDFQKVGVDTSQIRVKPGAKTGSVLCLSDKLGRRSLYVLPAANNLLAMDDLDLAYINQAKMLHISSFVNDRQFKILLELIDKLDLSTKVSFTPGALYAAKGLKALTPILNRTHVLFINQNELEQLTGEGILAGAKSCLKQGCRIIAVTLGQGTRLELSEGINRRTVTAVSYIRDAESEYVIEPDGRDTASEDATGAGDAFATGFIYGLLKDKGLQECGRLGNAVAQFSITKVGAREGLPTFNQLAQRHQELYSERL